MKTIKKNKKNFQNSTKPNELSASEALFGFVGWLTTRDEAVTFSSKHDSNPAAKLIKEFCERNKLTKPRDHWEKDLVGPVIVNTNTEMPISAIP